MKKYLATLIALSLSITAIMLISSCQTVESTTQETGEDYVMCDFAQLLNSLTINIASNNSASRLFPTFEQYNHVARGFGNLIGLVRIIGEHEVVSDTAGLISMLHRPHTITTVEVLEIFFSHSNQSHISIGDQLRVREFFRIEESELIIFGDSPPMMPGQEYIVFLNFNGDQNWDNWTPCAVDPNIPFLDMSFPTREDVSVDSQDRVTSTFAAFGRVGTFYSRMMHAAREEYLGIPNPLPEGAR